MQNLRDPGLEEMLSDPLIGLLMTSDHIHADEARMLFIRIAHRLGHRDSAKPTTEQAGETGPFGAKRVLAAGEPVPASIF
jgi:hypothetical protein